MKELIKNSAFKHLKDFFENIYNYILDEYAEEGRENVLKGIKRTKRAPAEFLKSKEPVNKESYEGLYDTDMTIEDKERIKLPEQTREYIWLN